MNINNTPQAYGAVSIVLHWLLATALLGMYFVGDYMVGLDYYDSNYHTLPQLHKSVGMVLAALVVLRLIWSAAQPKPLPSNPQSGRRERTAARLAHWALQLLTLALIISGYLISTAKGAGIEVFELFNVPALLPDDAARGELAGELHQLLGRAFMIVAALHASAALYHHFILKDRTLTRMLGIKGNTP